MLATSKAPDKRVQIPTRGALKRGRTETVPMVPKLRIRLKTTHRK